MRTDPAGFYVDGTTLVLIVPSKGMSDVEARKAFVEDAQLPEEAVSATPPALEAGHSSFSIWLAPRKAKKPIEDKVDPPIDVGSAIRRRIRPDLPDGQTQITLKPTDRTENWADMFKESADG